jgi:hypothetical protein
MAKSDLTPSGPPRERSDWRDIVETRLIQCPCADANCENCQDWHAMLEALDSNLRYENALHQIAEWPSELMFTSLAPAQGMRDVARDALGGPPIALEVEAQPGSEVLCARCAHVFCPHDDRLHFHHDGCPACSASKEMGEPIGRLVYEDGSPISQYCPKNVNGVHCWNFADGSGAACLNCGATR